jgi:hypothetical protein
MLKYAAVFRLRMRLSTLSLPEGDSYRGFSAPSRLFAGVATEATIATGRFSFGS